MEITYLTAHDFRTNTLLQQPLALASWIILFSCKNVLIGHLNFTIPSWMYKYSDGLQHSQRSEATKCTLTYLLRQPPYFSEEFFPACNDFGASGLQVCDLNGTSTNGSTYFQRSYL